MQILNERNELEVLTDLMCDVKGETFWVLDLAIKDFTLWPLTMLEEQVSSAYTLLVGSERVTIPSNWKVMIYDGETSDVDVIDVADLSGRDFTAFGYGPLRAIPKPLQLKVVEFVPTHTFVIPCKHKHHMWCLPVDSSTWIVCCDSDVHVKFLKDATIGDLIE